MSGSISDNHNAYFFQSILLFVQNTEGNEFGLKKRHSLVSWQQQIQKITIMEVEPAKLTWLAEAPPAGSNLQLRIWAIDYRRLLDCKSLPILGIGD
ncbi:Protein of unknown function [Gryllus bimaculatus]|nr:Protein of unknown function [Gryllus bimaculatus]